ncbi:MAG TPA: VapC toxin family PIN domain ribonuclease [Fibrobacteres bacterium]|jgi:predicted nucleic acid-binding protein|nr:VapC toxin family PIN domain ribonuclease [Fibrobacterota bacterium]
MILADTSIWIDYFRGINSSKTDLLNDLLDYERIAIGDLIITELMQGFRTKSQINAALRIISRLEYFDLAGKDIAFKAAENYRLMRKAGITIRKTIDIIIGTFCIENKFALLHNDRDFEPMAEYLGLVVL